ncbi:187_t:CDS:2, partial [Ambispora leptoticha]
PKPPTSKTQPKPSGETGKIFLITDNKKQPKPEISPPLALTTHTPTDKEAILLVKIKQLEEQLKQIQTERDALPITSPVTKTQLLPAIRTRIKQGSNYPITTLESKKLASLKKGIAEMEKEKKAGKKEPLTAVEVICSHEDIERTRKKPGFPSLDFTAKFILSPVPTLASVAET